MPTFFHLMAAEGLKLRRSQVGRLVWLLPVLFVALEFLVFEVPTLGFKSMTPQFQAVLATRPASLVLALWVCFFHPLMLALIPALLFRPEHRGKTWRHLYAMPVPRRGFYLAKAAWALMLCAGMLGLLGLLLLLEQRAVDSMNPILAHPVSGLRMLELFGWLWLGSLPVLAVYLWVSNRINSLAVPVMFGLVGLLLTVALTGQELPQPWRRDLIPWVLPYAVTERVVHEGPAQQAAHAAGQVFQPEADTIRLPSGRKVKTHQNVPPEALFPPPPPTPTWLLALFSAAGGGLLLALGWLDAGRPRA